MARAFFITGTDTGVGKTYALCALLRRIRQAGLPALGMKPIASGVDAAGKNEDIEAIRLASIANAANASNAFLPEDTPMSALMNAFNCYLFAPPIVPVLASREAGTPIRFPPILEAFARAKSALGEEGVILVEGVGGLLVPLGEEGDVADLAAALALPLILVVGMRLGCVNHALLTAEAIARRGLPFAGWIANVLPESSPKTSPRTSPNTPMSHLDENIEILRQRLPAPLLGVLPSGIPGRPEEGTAFLSLSFLTSLSNPLS